MRRRSLFLIVLATLALGVVGMSQVPEVQWRMAVLLAKASGRIADLSWPELIGMLLPGSEYYVEGLATNPNPYAVIVNPYSRPEDVGLGADLFGLHCAACHGSDARGGHAPDLVTRPLTRGDSDWALYRTIERGVPGTLMPAFDLEEVERWRIVAHLAQTRRGIGSAPQAPPFPEIADVTAARLERAREEPENWLMYSGAYDSWRFSKLSAITPSNVARMTLAWSRQFETTEYVESSPLVVDGVMFLTEPPSSVWALDAASGEVLWRYRRAIPDDVQGCCGRVNRGVAVFGGNVYLGTFDAHLVALDMRTGAVVWDTEVADYREGYSITSAPLAVRDKVVIGVSGSQFAVRGFIDAYDARSGQRAWRFHTVPNPDEYGGDTWSGDSWKTGGGAAWMTGSFDSERSLLYWGVGNPAPLFDGRSRLGDNLFTDSVLALEPETGTRVWHFQFTPHDEHDWDSTQIPVLIDGEVGGIRTPLMLFANRNAFYYVLDRREGRFLTAQPFGKQTWAKGIDERGRPILADAVVSSETGTLTWPGEFGATNWWSPSYSPRTNLFYVPYIELPAVFLKNEQAAAAKPGQEARGGATLYGTVTRIGVRALTPVTGDVVWDHEMPTRTSLRQIGGILTTAGNVLFTGNGDTFYALDAATAERVWQVNLGGMIKAGPVTYSVKGVQMVGIAAGRTYFAFRMPPLKASE